MPMCKVIGCRKRVSFLFILLQMICMCNAITYGTRRIGVLYQKNASGCLSSGRRINKHSPSWQKVEIVWRQVDHNSDIRIIEDVCSLIEDGVEELVTIVSDRLRMSVKSHAAALDVYHLPVDLRPLADPKDYGMQLATPLPIQIQIARDILETVAWTKVTVIFDEMIKEPEIALCLPQLFIDHVHIDRKTLRMGIKNTANVFSEISMFPAPGITHFLFIGRGELWLKFIIGRADLLEPAFYWVVISDLSPRAATRAVEGRPGSNLVLVREEWRRCLDKSPQDTPDFPEKHSLLDTVLFRALEMILGSIKPDILQPRTTVSTCSSFIANATKTLEYKQRLPLLRPPPGVCSYEIFSSCCLKNVVMEKVGNWRRDTGLMSSKKNLFLNAFHDFGKDPISIAATEAPPFITRTWENGTFKYYGFSVDILDEIASHLDFNYTIVEPPDNFYGSLNPDGTWNGMVGMVSRGEAEMAIGPFTITSIREQVIDFTIPFFEGSTGIITLSPGLEANKSLFQTLKPFSPAVWATLLAVVVVVGAISFLVNRLSPYGREEKNGPFQIDYERSLGDNLWMVYSSVMEQGIQDSPQAMSGRCVLGLWWIFTILLVATYTANLVAFLAVSLPPPPINTLGELLAQDHIDPIVQAGTSFETIFQEATTDLYRRVRTRMEESPRIPVQSAILELVRSGKYAYVGDRPLLAYIASNSCQTFVMADTSFDTVGYGMVIPQEAPYADIINHLIRQMHESGLIEKWRQRWWAPADWCSLKAGSSVKELGLNSLGGLFLSYGGIILLAGATLLAEIFMYRRTRQNITFGVTKNGATEKTQTKQTSISASTHERHKTTA